MRGSLFLFYGVLNGDNLFHRGPFFAALGIGSQRYSELSGFVVHEYGVLNYGTCRIDPGERGICAEPPVKRKSLFRLIGEMDRTRRFKLVISAVNKSGDRNRFVFVASA